MVATLFTVQPSDVPNNLQMEIIEQRNNNELKAQYTNLSPLDFYICADEFASPFKTTYQCQQFFSKRTLTKTLPTQTWKNSFE